MSVLLKNCGLRLPVEIDAAAASGANFVGFVHHQASPRHISLAPMAALVAHAKPALATVAVTVDPDDALIDALRDTVRPDYLQCHEVRTPARLQAIAARSGLPVIVGVGMRGPDDLAAALDLEPFAAHLLIDAAQPGSGMTLDWHALLGAYFRKPWFLAGGLTAGNVAKALDITHAPGVDVSSGIESSRGVKSLEMIAAFNAAVVGTSI